MHVDFPARCLDATVFQSVWLVVLSGFMSEYKTNQSYVMFTEADYWNTGIAAGKLSL